MGIPLMSLAFLPGCGSSTHTQGGGAVTIELTATAPNPTGGLFASPLIVPGGTVSVTAKVIELDSNNGVSWTLDPPTFGALTDPTSTSVTYTAPAQFSTSLNVTIIATSVTNPTVTASLVIPTAPLATLLSLPSPLSTVDTPASDQTLNPGDTLTVNARVSNTANPSDVTWTLSPPQGSLNVVSNPFASGAT